VRDPEDRQAGRLDVFEGRGATPLRIAIRSPEDRARFSVERVMLAGTVTAGAGVARVVVTVNGQEISRQEDARAGRTEVLLDVPVSLRDGKNVVLVTAVDARETTSQEARTLFLERPVTSATAVTASVGLRITLASPPDQVRIEQENIGLAGLIGGGQGVSSVAVTLNGVPVSRLDEPIPQRSVALNLPLRLREGPNTVVVTAVEADDTLHQEVRIVHYEPHRPLTITIHTPAEGARLTEAMGTVAAVVTSSKWVAEVTVALNGAEVHRQHEPEPRQLVALAVPVTLREGTNTVIISASEPDGTARPEIRTLIYEKPRPVATAPPEPDRWAVIIGVGAYEHPDIPRLRYTVADAEAFYQVLVESGFAREHVLLLTDTTNRKPTLRNVKWALGTFLARAARKDDTVLIFFAGHGTTEVDPRGVDGDGLAKYLVPIDADPDDLFSTALAMDDFPTIFGRIEAERVVAFLDTCYSGAAGGRTFAVKRTRGIKVEDVFLERLARAKGRAIVTASRPSEVSLELTDLGHGLFTYHLLRGLRGAAADRDGIVTLQELYQYVEREVTQKSRAVGGNQHPVMKGELEAGLPLVKVATP
jgi:hypothetical protein